jgi:hypothetical protein
MNMKFTIAGSKIICSRIDQTVEGSDRYRNVVDFDSQVDSVPPHVAAKLTRSEIRALEGFLEDRKRIKADPLEINMLEALPELIEEVTQGLRSADRLNEDLYERLTAAVEGLTEDRGTVSPEKRPGEDEGPIRAMRPMEILKERLGHIKQDL